MTKALTSFLAKGEVALPSDEQLAQALAHTVDEAGGVSQVGLNFLGFSGKQGTYSLGKTKDDITDEQLFLVEPAATIAGLTCWKDSKPVGKHKWLATEALVDPNVIVKIEDAEDHGPYRKNSGDGWKEMMGIGLLELNDMGTSIEFSSTAVSAINGLKDLIQEMSDRLVAGQPFMPIIWLGREQFTAQGNTNWKPTFNVETWVTRAAVQAFIEERLTQEDLLLGNSVPSKRKAAAKKPAATKRAPARKAPAAKK